MARRVWAPPPAPPLLLLLPLLLLSAPPPAAASRPPPPPPPSDHPRHTRFVTDAAPVVCILSQPDDFATKHLGGRAPGSYLAASYVKFVEMAGGLAAVLRDYDDVATRESTLGICNGLLIPGGGQDLVRGETFYDAARHAMAFAANQTARGNPYPVHGTCLGFEAMAVYLAGDDAGVLGSFDAEDAAAPLVFSDGARASQLFRTMDDATFGALSEHPYAMENHASGVALSSFEGRGAPLAGKLRVLSVSYDKQGKEYVSSVEGVPGGPYRDFTGVQWHPEKNAFEFNNEQHIPHGFVQDEVTFRMAQAFVERCRANRNRAPTEQAALDVLVYNTSPRFTARDPVPGGVESNFFQVYDV